MLSRCSNTPLVPVLVWLSEQQCWVNSNLTWLPWQHEKADIHSPDIVSSPWQTRPWHALRMAAHPLVRPPCLLVCLPELKPVPLVLKFCRSRVVLPSQESVTRRCLVVCYLERYAVYLVSRPPKGRTRKGVSLTKTLVRCDRACACIALTGAPSKGNQGRVRL